MIINRLNADPATGHDRQARDYAVTLDSRFGFFGQPCTKVMTIEPDESQDEKRDRRHHRPESCPEWHLSDPPIRTLLTRPGFSRPASPNLINTFHDLLQLTAKP